MRNEYSNRMSPNDLRVKVLRLSEVHDDEDIAAICNITVIEVQRIVATVARSKWWLRDNKTGRSWPARSRRGAYYLVCAFGLVDWDWGMGLVGENPQP